MSIDRGGVRIRPLWKNVEVGLCELGGIGGLLAIIFGSELADGGAPTGAIAVGIAVPLLGSLYLICARYVPMFAGIDAGADEVYYRNTWHHGSFRWSEVLEFRRCQLLYGYDVTRAILPGNRSVKLRAAPFDEFVALARRLAPPL